MIQRRTILAELATLPFDMAHAAVPALRVGDQKGGVQALMKAAGALDGLAYRIEWGQFTAAEPLLEALNCTVQYDQELIPRVRALVAANATIAIAAE